ncbi:outer membrane beta-barrel protein [Maribacter sp. HTCC2170]|uniref:outer membrane beta-barrel protein n=1 Tax=Maribacter sp. (strain HTCC2170 / KCCM 42371) TaxID=313603 RepID=UPI0011D26A20|nr:outer membrane beta-barrel protein [Maribacter sp. HTCC2170]
MKTIFIYELKRTAIAFAFFLSCSTSYGQAIKQESTTNHTHFNGFYIGLNLGYQNFFGGALIDDLDVLAQESKFALDFTPGFRKQFWKNKVVVGVEFLFGVTDGDLTTEDPRNQSLIIYENNIQTGLGVNAGIALGKQTNYLLYIYGQLARRNYDVTILNQNQTVDQQEDQQNFKRYGIGLEMPIWHHFSIKSMLGLTAVNFGDMITNIDVQNQIDFSVGLNYQF